MSKMNFAIILTHPGPDMTVEWISRYNWKCSWFARLLCTVVKELQGNDVFSHLEKFSKIILLVVGNIICWYPTFYAESV